MGPGRQVQSTLDHITIKGFRSLAHIDKLRLNDVNVLIGANGSGKSNFVEAFSFLRALRLGELRLYVAAAGGASQLLHFGAERTILGVLEIGLAKIRGECRHFDEWVVRLEQQGAGPAV